MFHTKEFYVKGTDLLYQIILEYTNELEASRTLNGDLAEKTIFLMQFIDYDTGEEQWERIDRFTKPMRRMFKANAVISKKPNGPYIWEKNRYLPTQTEVDPLELTKILLLVL